MEFEDLGNENKLRAWIIILYAILFVVASFSAIFISSGNWIRISFLILAIIFGVLLIEAVSQVIRNYMVKDNTLEQARRNLELQNIKLMKELGYTPNEEEFTNVLRKAIGKESIPPQIKKIKLKLEREREKAQIKELRLKINNSKDF